MTPESPPHIASAQQQLLQILEQVAKVKVDPLQTPWAEVEKGVIQLLGGAFQLDNPNHQGVAFGLTGVFGGRLVRDHQAFWFLNREHPEGVGIGFPEAMIMLSPLRAVVDALSQGRLSLLDDVAKDIRNSLAQVKFAASGRGAQRLSPADYQRLFDPGLIQFIGLAPDKVKSTLDARPDALTRDLRDAIGKAQLPAEAKQQLERQIVQGLQQLDPAKTVAEQAERSPKLAELMIHIFAAQTGTGAAPEEFWADVVFPLLHVGAPAQFPALDEEELEALKQGADPLFLYLDVVPYQTPAPEDGLLGAFAVEELSLPHPSLQQAGPPRLIQLDTSRFKQVLASFDAQKTRDSVARFREHLTKTAGATVPAAAGEGPQLLDAALTLLTDLQRTQEKGQVCVRRITEAEAMAEPALGAVRQALQAPRIILSP